MKQQPKLAEMIKGQVFDGYLLTRSAQQRTASNGSKYLDMTLCDVSGDVNAKLWDGTVSAPEVAQVLRIRGTMQEYNNRAQLKVDKLRPASETDDVDMSQLTPCAPLPASEMLDYIYRTVGDIGDSKLRELVERRLDACKEPLEYYPAAKSLHHAERAGLLHHTSTMLRTALSVCEIYAQLDRDLLIAGVVLHDMCKLTEMNSDKLGMVSDYSREGLLIGHLVQGAVEISALAREIGLDEELTLMLEHMILSHHDLPEYGSPRRPMFPEAEVLHILDLLDARMFEMCHALEGVKPGEFSEKIWSLERRLYRRK